MKSNRRKFTSKFKSMVVLEAISERDTINELALKFDLHQNQIRDWKKKFIEKAHLVFELEENESVEKKTRNNESESMNEKLFSLDNMLIQFPGKIKLKTKTKNSIK